MWLCPEQASISLMVLFLTGCVTVGDTMNTASRMESTCRLGCVHVSDVFGNLLPHEDWESTGGVEVGTVIAAGAFMHLLRDGQGGSEVRSGESHGCCCSGAGVSVRDSYIDQNNLELETL